MEWKGKGKMRMEVKVRWSKRVRERWSGGEGKME